MIRVNLPHMDATGLSEGWLFRHCGDLHWQRLCAALGIRSHELANDRGERLYPVFVAIRARYDRPLSRVAENDELHSSIELAHYGRAFFRSTVSVGNADGAFTLEMITTFASRVRASDNDLHRTTPAAPLRYAVPSLAAAPALLAERQAVRRRETSHHAIAGHRVLLADDPDARRAPYEPSPYSDYNGVGLLYFAAYPIMVDTVERQLVRRSEWSAAGVDWAIATSTVARDVFYYRNLALGDRLVVTLNRLERASGEYAMHSIISREHDGAPVADVVTIKREVTTADAQAGERTGSGAVSSPPAPGCCSARRRRAQAPAGEAATSQAG